MTHWFLCIKTDAKWSLVHYGDQDQSALAPNERLLIPVKLTDEETAALEPHVADRRMRASLDLVVQKAREARLRNTPALPGPFIPVAHPLFKPLWSDKAFAEAVASIQGQAHTATLVEQTSVS